MQAAFQAVENDDILNVSFDRLQGQAQGSDANGAYSNGATTEASFTPAVASSGPPLLSLGADDIFWMSKLHTALLEVKKTSSKCAKKSWLAISPRILCNSQWPMWDEVSALKRFASYNSVVAPLEYK